MKAFSALLDRVVLTPGRNAKRKLLADYFRDVPDPDRGYALAAIAGTLDVANVKPKLLRELVMERIDEQLFRYSYDYVGDLAETIALIWDNERDPAARLHEPRLSEVIESLNHAGKTTVRGLVRDRLDALDSSGRYAFLKLATGSFRMGVSARLAMQALAELGDRDATEIEAIWHGLKPPYEPLFAWIEGRADRPVLTSPVIFHPVMLANPVQDGDLAGLDPRDYAAEWKWDGIRIQLTCRNGLNRIFSRSGEDISASFPDILLAITFEGTVDGELLVGGSFHGNGAARPFSDLQQRLNRKAVTARTLEEFPAFVRSYDLLFRGNEDIRAMPFLERREALKSVLSGADPLRFDLSPLVEFASWEELDHLRKAPPDPVIEGVMLKRLDSAYQAGRYKGPWFKWKRDPHTVDAVLIYAQRGHGKRSSFYSDFTFGVWTNGPDGEHLVPVGKAYFGFTDAELQVLDRFVRNNTIDRFGPVRVLKATKEDGFVVEVAFEGLNRSNRHKSGVAMRFPRIVRLRTDKLPADADRLETLKAMIDG
nr:cisplatin damage response ATP-dependent DNA ligase [uncultured Gellertiella sp.]